MSQLPAPRSTRILPPQRQGIIRLGCATPWQGTGDGIEASRDCGELTGPARSMCYAMEGIVY